MWFIPMIIGLYIVLPMIKQITKDEKIIKYFLLCWLIFFSLIPTINIVTHDFASQELIDTWDIIYKTVLSLKINSFFGMIGFFIGGYYFNTIDLNKRKRMFIYCLGLIGGVLTVILQYLVAIKIQNRHQTYYNVSSIFVITQVLALFVWFKYTEFSHSLNLLGAKLAQYSFGIYLVHPFILEELKNIGVNTLSFNSIFSVPIIASIVYAISVFIIAILNNIPILKKYAV